MRDNKCSKHYPRPSAYHTTASEDGYVQYHRRPPPYETEITVSVDIGEGTATEYRVGPRGVFLHNRWVDNSWVVPYNPAMSLKYNAHINFELCASIRSVKYLYKYIYKGPD